MRASACFVATSPMRSRCASAAWNSRAAPARPGTSPSTERRPTPTADTSRSRMRRRRSRTPAGRRSRTSRVRCCPVSRGGPARSAPSIRIRRVCSPGTGDFFAALDASYRSSFSSSASASRYLVVDSYSLLNARVGFRWTDGWTVSLWSRNLLDKDYFELLSAAPGNTGLYVGQPGEGRTVGVTLRIALRAR